ncbi:universal stress protein [Natronosalvus amylolyticus]|uniref:universal stress protein n=1 Tax=Natronosalvus amylolyticus TaxID=2961994 RepID=UPI0020C9D884|nr:universal stress protein [Natronosalvus amylolyticus]
MVIFVNSEGSTRQSPTNISDTTSEDEFVVFVPLSNPRTETHLITLGAAIANQRDDRVVAVTIIQVPDQTSLQAARDRFEVQDSKDQLAGARRTASDIGAPIETRTIFSHRLFKTVFDTARQYEADLCLMGCGSELPGISGRTEPLIDELAHSLPCDFLVFKDRGFDLSNVLLPTTGGPHTELAADIARVLQTEFGSELTMLHVADDPDEGERFLASWASKHGLEGAAQRVEVGDIETAIESAAREHTMILIGATQVGVLSRLARGSLTLDVLQDVECSVLITERKTERGFFERIFRRQ